MTEKGPESKRQEEFAYFMDLASHDVLNNNQAVLGYLDLILASPGLDQPLRKFAEKAVTQVRISTLLVEDIRSLMTLREPGGSELRPVMLESALARAERELKATFPSKTITLRGVESSRDAAVLGDSRAETLILTALVNAVKMDPSDDVTIDVTAREAKREGGHFWELGFEDRAALLPESVKGEKIDALYLRDSSTAVKLAGLLFADMMAARLGGAFEVSELGQGAEKRGLRFKIFLRKAGVP